MTNLDFLPNHYSYSISRSRKTTKEKNKFCADSPWLSPHTGFIDWRSPGGKRKRTTKPKQTVSRSKTPELTIGSQYKLLTQVLKQLDDHFIWSKCTFKANLRIRPLHFSMWPWRILFRHINFLREAQCGQWPAAEQASSSFVTNWY